MPSMIKVRGRRVYRATVMVKGTRKDKLFPDGTKKSFRAAAEWERETREQLIKEMEAAEEQHQEIHTASLSVESWLEEYLNEARLRFVEKTYQEKKGAFERLGNQPGIKPYTPVEDLTISACRRFLSKQFEQRSGYAANKDRKNLSAAWEWGRSNFSEWPAGNNPFHQVPKFPETRQTRYVPSEEDFWKVFDVAEGQDKVMLLTLLHLAARKGEVFRLTIHDVDIKNSQIRLSTRKRRGGHQEFDWIPMTANLKSALLEWIKYRMALPGVDRQHIFICLDKTAFCDAYYGKPFTNRQHFMKRICKKAGVRHFGFHAIRHLTASILYQQGEAVAVIQAILRHKSPNTTERYLRRLFGSEHTRRALEKLDRPASVIDIKRTSSNS